ncbi:2-hydroxyacid dehydrogenase [Halorubrum vacuolatum]|uniref:D-3-phosphoglycerate dehydrogenase n=1 Tax=Halorubrum vacuolatum TaxID=63740 RepID=A0A238YKJ3_HALVU|nr:NAD(P)-dependent oxidoreductase [Halorubrum vacuolatum]SNR71144.1 D-3-phosphoglycerate dehydrogenase [Halorubrum vacuolatum]
MRRAIVDQDITPTDQLLAGLPDDWEVTVGIENSRDAVIEALQGTNVAFVTSRVPMSRDVIENAPKLEMIAKLGTGIDNIDCKAAAEHSIPVTHTPGYNALSVAEHTLCLTLATARRLTAARNLIENSEWRDSYDLGMRVSGTSVGVVGFGDIGKRFARLLSGFDVEILAHDPFVPEIDTELVGATMTDLDSLLRQSDIIVLTTEFTEETRGLIGDSELSKMNSSAILINTARGPVVEEAALIDALRKDSIGGAGLDVFTTEPLDSNSELLEFDHVVVTPHIAAMTTPSRIKSINRLTTNVKKLFDGAEVPERYMATPF